jgi:hypothetical protein
MFELDRNSKKIRKLTSIRIRITGNVPLKNSKESKKFVKNTYYLQAIRLVWIRRRRKKTLSGSGASWMMKRTGPGPDSA